MNYASADSVVRIRHWGKIRGDIETRDRAEITGACFVSRVHPRRNPLFLDDAFARYARRTTDVSMPTEDCIELHARRNSRTSAKSKKLREVIVREPLVAVFPLLLPPPRLIFDRELRLTRRAPATRKFEKRSLKLRRIKRGGADKPNDEMFSVERKPALTPVQGNTNQNCIGEQKFHGRTFFHDDCSNFSKIICKGLSKKYRASGYDKRLNWTRRNRDFHRKSDATRIADVLEGGSATVSENKSESRRTLSLRREGEEVREEIGHALGPPKASLDTTSRSPIPSFLTVGPQFPRDVLIPLARSLPRREHERVYEYMYVCISDRAHLITAELLNPAQARSEK